MQSSPRIDELRQKFHENPRRYFAPLANEYRKAGDPEQAIAICRAHLAQQPGHMSGHVVYGQALYDARRMNEAEVVFQQALALDPENVIVLRHLGDIARQRGDVEAARTWYSRALDGDPHDAEVAAYLAELTEPLRTTVPESQAAEPEPAADALPTAAEPPAPEATPAEAAVEAIDADDSPYLDVPLSLDEADDVVDAEDLALVGNLAQPGDAPERDEVVAGEEKESPPEETARMATPASESTPIVTRTLAELYLEQGHIEPALEIYRQLAEREPEDTAIRERISELSADEKPEEVLPTAPATPTPAEAGLMEEAAGAGEVGGLGEEALESETGPAISDDAHFSETELSTELWDTADSWGADLFVDDADEFFGLRMDVGETALEPPLVNEPVTTSDSTPAAEPAVNEPEEPPEEVAHAEAQEERSAEPLAEQYSEAIAEPYAAPPTSPYAESDAKPYADQYAENESASESGEIDESDRPWGEPSRAAQIADLETVGTDNEPGIPARASVDDALVDAESERTLTVREFFATLGSVRPPSREVDEAPESAVYSEPTAAEAEAPEAPSVATEDYVFADDAFASLFADVPVSPEDNRAAAALSSAVAHNGPLSAVAGPVVAPPHAAADATEIRVETTTESEEDIRRFREWLDGLGES